MRKNKDFFVRISTYGYDCCLCNCASLQELCNMLHTATSHSQAGRSQLSCFLLNLVEAVAAVISLILVKLSGTLIPRLEAGPEFNNLRMFAFL